MNKYKRLAGDTLIYFIGNSGSKIVSLLMVSFYSFFLTAEQFGRIDVTQTTIALVLPFLTLCIHEAVLRFSLLHSNETKDYFSNGFAVVLGSSLLSIPLSILLSTLKIVSGNIFLIAGLIIFEGFYTLFTQFLRGIKKTKIFAISGIVFTIIMSISNILFLSVFHFGVNGYFLSLIIGYLAAITFAFFFGKIYLFIRFNSLKTDILKKMLIFSIPLIPNSLMWFLMNAADKYVILLLLGEESNGIYAVAGKIPTVLSAITTIILQAWQISAIIESKSDDRNVFYTKVFSILSFLLLFLVSSILIVLRPVLQFAISSSYKEVWRYVPFLLISSVFSCFATFLGTNYSAMGKTKGAFFTTLIGGLLNIVLNFIFIKMAGLNGAAIGTAISFLIVWIIRIIDTKKFVIIKIDFQKMFLNFSIVFFQIAAIYKFDEILGCVIGIFCLLLLIIFNHSLLFDLIVSFKGNKND